MRLHFECMCDIERRNFRKHFSNSKKITEYGNYDLFTTTYKMYRKEKAFSSFFSFLFSSHKKYTINCMCNRFSISADNTHN